MWTGEQSLIVQGKPLQGRTGKEPGSLANLTYTPKVYSDQEDKEEEHCDPKAGAPPSEERDPRRRVTRKEGLRSTEVRPMVSQQKSTALKPTSHF